MTPTHTASLPSPVLELIEISKSFGSLVALKSLSVSVKPGEFIAIVGPSGSEKAPSST